MENTRLINNLHNTNYKADTDLNDFNNYNKILVNEEITQLVKNYYKINIIFIFFVLLVIILQGINIMYTIKLISVARNLDLYPFNKDEIEIYKIKLEKLINYACSNLIKC